MIDISNYLTEEQMNDYIAYIELRKQADREGWHHWHRIANSRETIKQEQVKHCIPFEGDIDGPAPVLHPSDRFISELMAGNIHPPIDAVHNQKLLLIAKSGKYEVVSKIDAAEWREKNGPLEGEIVVDNRRCHEEVVGPMSYAQAIEYCILKDIPRKIWDQSFGSNYQQFWIISKDVLKDRTYRNAWKLNTEIQQEKTDVQ